MRSLLTIAAALLVLGQSAPARDDDPTAKPKANKRPAAMAGPVNYDQLFVKLDADNDGKLTKDEFKKLETVRAALAAPAGKLDPKRLEQLKKRLESGKLDPEQAAKIRKRLGIKPEAPASQPVKP